jgi:MATE family multidrug resistance protein
MWVMTDNEELMRMAFDYRWWIVILPVASGAAFIWDGIYVGVTASRAMRNTMIVASLFIFLPTYYFTIDRFENHALWLALNLFMISRGVLMWIMAKRSVYT